MKIGLIVYSHTGNTLSVAKKLEDTLAAGGHDVAFSRVEPVNDDPRAKEPVKLLTAPDISLYEAIIFASPVQGFSLAPPMKIYLEQISDLSHKKIYCFVTQHLKKPWLGGNRAVRQINTACRAKGGNLIDGEVINWSANQRDEQIAAVVQKLSRI